MSDVELGTILGGRYKVTREIIQTDAGDRVFDGEDQTLKRNVSITLSTAKSAGEIAESARQIALGNVQSDLQIIDLGLKGEKAYVVTNDSRVPQIQDSILHDTSNVLKAKPMDLNQAAPADDFDSLLATAAATKVSNKSNSRPKRKAGSKPAHAPASNTTQQSGKQTEQPKVSATPIPGTQPQASADAKVTAQKIPSTPAPSNAVGSKPVNSTPVEKPAEEKTGFLSGLSRSLKKLSSTDDRASDNAARGQENRAPQNQKPATPPPAAPSQKKPVAQAQKKTKPTGKAPVTHTGKVNSSKVSAAPIPVENKTNSSAQSVKKIAASPAVGKGSLPLKTSTQAAIKITPQEAAKQEAAKTQQVQKPQDLQKNQQEKSAVTKTPIPAATQQQQKPQKTKPLVEKAAEGKAAKQKPAKEKKSLFSRTKKQDAPQQPKASAKSSAPQPVKPPEKRKAQAATTAVEVAPVPVEKRKSVLPEKKDLSHVKKVSAKKLKSSAERKKKATLGQTIKNVGKIQARDFRPDPITPETPKINPIKISTVSGSHIFEHSQYFEEEPKDKSTSYVMRIMAAVIALATLVGLGGTALIYFANRASNDPSGGAAAANQPPKVVSVNHIPNAKNPTFEQNHDVDLKNIYDENPDTWYNTDVYQGANYDGKADELTLVLNLKRKVPISTVTINKAQASGGKVEVWVSDSASWDNFAHKVAESDLNSTSVKIALPPGTAAQHVFLNFTQLPKRDNGYQLSISDVELQ